MRAIRWTMASICGAAFASALAQRPPALAPFARATEARLNARALAQYARTSWSLRDGGPADVHAIVQTQDGMLWLGGSTGLVSFDGVTFERVPFPDRVQATQPVLALAATPDGALWIGFQEGLLGRWHRGQFTRITTADGLPRGATHALAVDSSGRVWVASPEGLAHIEGTRAIPVGAARGFTGTFPLSMTVDRRGTLWVGDATGVFALVRTATVFTRVAPSDGPLDAFTPSVAPNGAVWATTRTGTVAQLTDSTGVPSPRVHRTSLKLRGSFLIDRSGNSWHSSPDGIVRLSLESLVHRPPLSPRVSDHLGRADGLSGALVYCIVEDREGNVWVGTEGGVDRLRASRLTPERLPIGHASPTLLPLHDGGVMVASSARAPLVIDSDGWRVPAGADGIFAAHGGPADVLWLGGRSGLWQSVGKRFVSVALPPEARGVIAAIAAAPDGRLWVSVLRRGVFRREGSRWTTIMNRAGEPLDAANAIAVDRDGHAWMGLADRVAVDLGDSISTITHADGMRIGRVQALHVRGDRVWIAGAQGLMLHEGGRLHGIVGGVRTNGAVDTIAQGLTGVVERANGDVWLNGAAGVLRVPKAEITRVLRDGRAVAAVDRYDMHDGLDGAPVALRPSPTVVEGADGRLWFATKTAVAWVRPDRMRRNTIRPPVQIRALTVDDSSYGAQDSVRLPARARTVQIRYAALSLSIPERVRFRVRLDGVDTGWRDVGGRRQMEYQNLPPGRYAFHAIAANEDGAWSDVAATTTFTIPPTLTQTRAFALLCALSALLAAYGLYTLRLRRQSGALRARFDATLAERTRIAQDLHDTLLQGFTGITMQLQGLQDTIARRPDRAPATLSRIMESADAALREARYAVWDMRDPAIDVLPLPELLGNAARALVDGTAISLRVRVRGESRAVSPLIETTALRIVREAVSNAVRHAAPREIELDIGFDAAWLTIRVRDDGSGIAEAQSERAAQRGHWGVMGMRDRAGRVGGTLQLGPRAPHGTELRATLPLHATAYDSSTETRPVVEAEAERRASVRAAVAVLPTAREPDRPANSPR